MSIVIQKTRQLRMQKSKIRLVRRWTVLSFDSSALQPGLQNNLYKLWNRMSSGSYFPPPASACRSTSVMAARGLAVAEATL